MAYGCLFIALIYTTETIYIKKNIYKIEQIL